MNKTAIIIPSRLEAVRLPNKPLELINQKEMILHVYEAAKKTNMGDVYVASPDQKIKDLIKSKISHDQIFKELFDAVFFLLF